MLVFQPIGNMGYSIYKIEKGKMWWQDSEKVVAINIIL